MSKGPRSVLAGLTVLGVLARLLWSPSLWKALYLWRTYLVSISKSGYLPGIYYSQDAEDVSLLEILPEEGFFVDVGAHHPERFSVTKLLYEKGWRGINIDVTPEIHSEFPLRRSRDRNIYALIGRPGEATFYRFAEEALNTTSQERADYLLSIGHTLTLTENLRVFSLSEILDQLGTVASVDLLNVDVEGADLEALKSLDWDKYVVGAVLVEVGKPVWDLPADEVAEFLAAKGFRPTLCFPRSVLFLSGNHPANEFFRR